MLTSLSTILTVGASLRVVIRVDNVDFLIDSWPTLIDEFVEKAKSRLTGGST